MSISGRYPRLQEKLRRAVLDAPADTDPTLRRVAYHGDDLPEPLQAYVDKLWRYAYRVQDSDIERMRGAGYSEDQIFEVTIAAALGAGDSRRRAGMSALNEALR
ncbi:hypothetical protein I546_5685 [Mycobacterium kansasii 732]|uniref:Uncharacterized protein n=1 Tax=Mycobacterium pseudokansasii TaxID=2341080 RepID=A0A498QZM8_9MYCO|nr:hypothetical protein [Mycobacterium pseudokansasii]EUA06211.1 hypothetical protein I546_5685 [Mycobacterium kansasii 732]KZS62944.1 hypothetical protein A4G27_12570 [Mycobacterium kansasii]MBY0387180.1 hypothetical protein [Mycobacterium pseudokansasii]VBA33705.1 hypothetical protein LAUMK35_05548 [Mycobacterium pseudokansasii]VBA35282.1 hypothetical protein LAUMK21_05508 [Mycobacterium pseudokansasii]